MVVIRNGGVRFSIGSKSIVILVAQVLFVIVADYVHADESPKNLYQEVCAVISRESIPSGIHEDTFSTVCRKYAQQAQEGLALLIETGDYSVFARHIGSLFADLSYFEAKYFPRGTNDNIAFLKQIQFDQRGNRSRTDTLRYVHMLSDSSILLLPPIHSAQRYLSQNNGNEKKLIIHFFGSATCGECHQIRTELLKPLSEKHAEILDIRIHDIDDEQGYQMLDALEKAYNVSESLPIQLYLPDTFLAGGETIKKHGRALIEQYLASPSKWDNMVSFELSKSSTETIRQRFQRFSFIGIVAAGLVDGINPCAIATMIFLISFLATQKRKRTEVLCIGLFFTFSVFTTYLLLGLGAFKVLTLLDSYRWLSRGIKWSAVLLAGGIGVVSFYDAAAYAITRKTGSIKLQLPKAVKLRIHRVVSENLTGSKLVIGAVVTGFLVTLLEAVCTGQVYLPTIILMTRQGGLRLQGWLYLLLYNFLFVLPLLIVMLLAYCGLTWKSLSSITQKHLPVLKVLLGFVLVGLAVFLGISM